MSKQSMENFINYLQKEKIYNVNPIVLTAKEIVVYGRVHGFKISLDDVKEYIDELEKIPESEMNKVTVNWRI